MVASNHKDVERKIQALQEREGPTASQPPRVPGQIRQDQNRPTPGRTQRTQGKPISRASANQELVGAEIKGASLAVANSRPVCLPTYSTNNEQHGLVNGDNALSAYTDKRNGETEMGTRRTLPQAPANSRPAGGQPALAEPEQSPLSPDNANNAKSDSEKTPGSGTVRQRRSPKELSEAARHQMQALAMLHQEMFEGCSLGSGSSAEAHEDDSLASRRLYLQVMAELGNDLFELSRANSWALAAQAVSGTSGVAAAAEEEP